MRDSFATINLNAGVPLEWISEQMGHSEIDTTRKHYARWLPSGDDRILDALDAAARSQTHHESTTNAAEAR